MHKDHLADYDEGVLFWGFFKLEKSNSEGWPYPMGMYHGIIQPEKLPEWTKS